MSKSALPNCEIRQRSLQARLKKNLFADLLAIDMVQEIETLLGRQAVENQLAKTPVILAVGLTRAWAKGNDDTERHWLQVNNIHFEDDPLGEIFEF